MEDIRPYDLCIERAPESGAPYLSRGKCHMRNGSHAAAKADFEKALSLPLDPNVPPDERGIYYDRPEEADAHLQLGAALVELGDLAGAEPHMDRGVQLEPREPAYTARGAVRLLRDDLAGARADLDRALELDARSERARRHRARLHEREGNLAAAEADLAAALARDPLAEPARSRWIELRQRQGKSSDPLEDRSAPEDPTQR